MFSQEMDVDGEDDDEIGIPKASKKKVVKAEDTKSKKEHVNVVFIGHVGKCLEVPVIPEGLLSHTKSVPRLTHL